MSRKKQIKGFDGTEFSLPLLYAIKGVENPNNILSPEMVKGNEHINRLIYSEIRESEEEDNSLYFITDDRFRSLCVGLNEGTNGWILLVGLDKEINIEYLFSELENKRLKAFVSGTSANILRDSSINFTDLGPRDSGLIYFGQLLVRYALIYGRDLDAHGITHIIEEFAPGAILLLGDPNNSERTLLQGMLGIGIPVIALRSDHGLTGHVVVSELLSDIMEKVWKLPNIRARNIVKATPEIPVPSGPLFRNETLEKEEKKYIVRGSEHSFIISKPSFVEKDNVYVQGDLNKATGFSLLVEISNHSADPTITLWVDAIIRKVSNYAKGLKIKGTKGGEFELKMTEELLQSGFELKHLGNLIITELRNEFPSIGPLRITIILDREEEAKIKPDINEYVKKRKKLIEEASEDNLENFFGCTRCRSFSLGHACTVTPERPAQCSKPWYMLKAYAVLAPESTYNPCQLIKKGECISPHKGEYRGVNKATDERTNGLTRRVFLHSIFDYPHTACSCFQNIAFYIPEVGGIGVMDRGFQGVAPGDNSWTKLANHVAGGQYKKGAASIATQYLRSPKFLQADGGYSRVVWMSEKLLYFAKNMIPEEHISHISTEKDARTLDELKKFLE